MSWTGTRADFVKQYGPTIISEAAGTGLFPEIVLAQAFIEGSDNAGVMGNGLPMKHGNNIFNIKVSPDWTGATLDAEGNSNEYDPTPDPTKMTLPFIPEWRAYDNLEDSIKDYFEFLQDNVNYKDAGVFTAATPAAQAQALQKAGYAGASTTYGAQLTALAASAKKLLDGVTGGDTTPDNDYLFYGLTGLGIVTAAALLWPKKAKSIAGIAGLSVTEGIIAGALVVAGVGAAYYYEKDIPETPTPEYHNPNLPEFNPTGPPTP